MQAVEDVNLVHVEVLHENSQDCRARSISLIKVRDREIQCRVRAQCGTEYVR